MNFFQNVDIKKIWKIIVNVLFIVQIAVCVSAFIIYNRVDMTKLPTEYVVNIVLDVFVIIILTMLFFSIMVGNTLNTVTTLFECLIFDCMIYQFLDELEWSNFALQHKIINVGGHLFIYVNSIIMLILFWYLICAWSGYDKALFRTETMIINIVSLIGVVLIFGNLLWGYYYTIDECGYYSRSNTYYVSMICPFLLIVISVRFILKWNISFKSKLLFLSYPLLPYIGAAFTVNAKGPTLLGIWTFVSVFLIYSNLFILRERQLADYEAQLAQKELVISHKETEIANSKANVIMSQIKPHFLYNSIGAIMGIAGNPPETKKALKNFANYLRGNIQSVDGSNIIPFAKEIEHVKQYTSLEMLRFDDVVVECELSGDDFMIPQLTVQMLVENAILHGVSPKEGGGLVKVRDYTDGNIRIVEVSDDGLGFDIDELNNSYNEEDSGNKHVGLKNVSLRLEMVNGKLEVNSQKGKGTVAKIKLFEA